MITYVDSSVLARAYLADEVGHDDAVRLMEDPDVALVTGTWSRVEVSGALVRAARGGRGDEKGLLALLDADLGHDGPVAVVAAPQPEVEAQALQLVRRHAIRAMDAWHLATAALTLPALAEPGEDAGFASRDEAQLEVARLLGFRVL
ncbi:MAG TPA: type II toxin-antitoxin system VapC family toxin [Candidatus Dormibacteraeota bacterium]